MPENGRKIVELPKVDRQGPEVADAQFDEVATHVDAAVCQTDGETQRARALQQQNILKTLGLVS